MKPSDGQAGQSFQDLVAVMRRLLAPGGCPWDREQTLETLRPYLVEETYELLDALERGGPDEHREELGDLLMQIVFQAELRAAEGAFGIDDVCRTIADKLVRRHPHVFGGRELETADEVVTQWEDIKAREKEQVAGGPVRVLAGVPLGMPALARAQKLSARAAHVGFDWPDVRGCRAKVDEELRELDRAVERDDPNQTAAELGDLLFAAVSLARKLGVDAEGALRGASARFQDRFEWMEDRLAEAGKRPADSDLEELDALWERAKQADLPGS
jgi:MazG family protein